MDTATEDRSVENTLDDLRVREGESYGGSADGIRDHYDISNQFWPNILGSTMAYSSALFRSEDESLDVAQQRKLDWHIHSSAAFKAETVLDVGCGWGSMLRPLSNMPQTRHIVGITLSEAQSDYLAAMALPDTEVRVENWAEHHPLNRYDSIISIGAFEHFAKPGESEEEKIAVYRDFFSRCHQWLSENGRMSLQTIAYGNMNREDASEFINDVIFPDSDLPYLHEIIAAVKGLFEVVAVCNDRIDYAITMDHWAKNLKAHRESALDQIGAQRVQEMEQFFKMASMGFRMGKQQLLRFSLRPISKKWTATGSEDWKAKSFRLRE